MTISNFVPTIVTAQVVEERRRLQFLPAYFDRYCVVTEQRIFKYMRKLSTDYQGGSWKFYELSNGGCFMCPDELHDVVYRCSWDENYYDGSMSPEAAGITVCLMAYSRLSFSYAEPFTENYHRLREFALDHEEANQIFRALD